MKITRNQLRQIIQEGLKDLREAPFTVDDLMLAADTDINRPIHVEVNQGVDFIIHADHGDTDIPFLEDPGPAFRGNMTVPSDLMMLAKIITWGGENGHDLTLNVD